MEKRQRTRELLMKHFRRYPKLQIEDIFKYIHQSAAGCEHMVSSLERATDYIRKERENSFTDVGDPIDILDGAYSRVHLSCLDEGVSVETLGKLFYASAKKEENSRADIEEKLGVARSLVVEGALPFALQEFDGAVAAWKAAGYPAVHHSETFRAQYHPAYRVIANSYVTFLPLLARIDRALSQGSVTVAVEGGSASGKTTLGKLLAELYDCNVFHMDDFFLRPEQRTAERYAEIGGNVDRERFLEEVLIPHSKGEAVNYRKFDCSTFSLGSSERIVPRKLTVVEGAYSMHPELAPYYDLSVFLDISPEAQRVRIGKRNPSPMAERFFNEWIPLEQVYFNKMHVKQRCDMCISIDE